MTQKLELFLQCCRAERQVTLIGPTLDSTPEWPDSPILFVDGGARWQPELPERFSHPCLSVGDGDSLGNRSLDILLDTQKDCSDLEYALGLLKVAELRQLDLLGFLGGRRDHEWINFGVIAQFLQSGTQQTVTMDSAVCLYAPGDYRLSHHGVFSLVHFQHAKTAIRGAVDYPLDEPTEFQPGSSLGLSNRAHGNFSISSNAVTMCFWL